MRFVRRLIFLGAFAVLMLAMAAPALAENPAQNAYSQFSQFNASSSSSSTLPFTGIDSGLVALVGLVLVGAGLVVRQRTRARLD
jgi:LPXTG-motif cell wall-anchored protein